MHFLSCRHHSSWPPQRAAAFTSCLSLECTCSGTALLPGSRHEIPNKTSLFNLTGRSMESECSAGLGTTPATREVNLRADEPVPARACSRDISRGHGVIKQFRTCKLDSFFLCPRLKGMDQSLSVCAINGRTGKTYAPKLMSPLIFHLFFQIGFGRCLGLIQKLLRHVRVLVLALWADPCHLKLERLVFCVVMNFVNASSSESKKLDQLVEKQIETRGSLLFQDTHMVAALARASLQVKLARSSFSISVLANCRPFPIAHPR